MELPFDADQQQTIREHLTREMELQGVSVDESAKMILTASVNQGKKQKSEMSSFTDLLGIHGTEKIKYTPTISRLILSNDGETIWESKNTNTNSGVLHLQGDETAQQAAKRVCKANPSYFSSIRIPSNMSQLPKGEVGESKLSPSIP